MGRYSGIFFRGAAMGAADVVPGVSGGTIAFITGIYDELIDSLKAIDINALRILFSRGLFEFWRHINGNFLISLLIGVAFSVFTLAHAISYLLEHYAAQTSAFFFGLVAASSWFIYRQMPAGRFRASWFIVGIAFAVAVGLVRPAEIPVTPLSVFLSGAVAICAMILPGISGSFILLLLGMYQPVLGAVKSLDVATILVFSSGCSVGLVVFVRLLSLLLHRYRASILSWLTGILLGSLSIIWPWKESAGEGMGGFTMHNILPTADPVMDVLLCVALAASSVVLVFVLENRAGVSAKATS
ncbi:DUF368 domain-containing protein [Microbulbifer sp. SAOS-129_SWC]|uniref:DUF368 domain-containing protein n=1 Tax=Microbulbifer sp. SAOS-129_SWC TaxID=3145235 RepID=UPI0032171E98